MKMDGSPNTNPRNLEEQLALEKAKHKPRNVDDEIMRGKIKDLNYPAEDWKKCEHAHEHPNGIITEVHYWENRHTDERHGFKFKGD